jgi:maltooligosyltrehalose trehalohydrolase
VTAPRTGAWLEGDGVTFRVWAPDHARVTYVLYSSDGATIRREMDADAEAGGYFALHVPGVGAGQLYRIRPGGGGPFPDPASRSQPRGVHGPSEVVSDAFAWTDRGFTGRPIEDLVIYEVHVGAATPEGTFDALVPKLAGLRALGVTALELMPIASFPGSRGWGYDGVALYAPHASYGGPDGLRRLVDAAHAEGLAVLLDVVYNHLGPDGNYLRCYARDYFTDRHTTPWGDALHFDGPGSAPVREHFLANAAMWIRDHHLDGLRLDATHAIADDSPVPIVQAIADRARAAAPDRRVVVIAEDERNVRDLVLPVPAGGQGLDGVWADDFHHAMRRLLAGDRDGYYRDYRGDAAEIATILERGWLYEGAHSIHHGGPRGTSAEGIDPASFVHCLQNHDQIGNRALGDRLGASVGPGLFRAASALLLLSPHTPLIFMGQEWNASTPFLYFTDHHEELGRAVTEGRRREFAAFGAFAKESIPDPQAESTFLRSKLDPTEAARAGHAGTLAWYRALLRLRAEHPALASSARRRFRAEALGREGVAIHRFGGGARLVVVVALLGDVDAEIEGAASLSSTCFSEEARFGGRGGTPSLAGDRVAIPRGSALVLAGA